MKLRTRLILPSLISLLILIGLGSAQLYQDHLLQEENTRLENLKDKLLDSNYIISEKIETHFKKAIRLLTELEIDNFEGDFEKEIKELKQIEINSLTYIDNISILLAKATGEHKSPISPLELKRITDTTKEYFQTMHRALSLMTTDPDTGDIYLMQAAELSIDIRAKLRHVTRNVEKTIHTIIFQEESSLSRLLSILWWIAFIIAILLTVAFILYSNRAATQIHHVFEKFKTLFPDTIQHTETLNAQESIAQLEWLADHLEKTKGALNSSRQQMDELISQSSSAIYVHRNMRPLFANRALVELCGYDTEADLLGLQSTSDILAPEERQRVSEIHAARLRGEDAPNLYEMEIIRTDGTPRWVLNKSFVIDWEGEKAICTTLIDITDRKKAERNLSDSEDRFNELLELTPDPIFIHTVEGEIVDVNIAACHSLGYSHKEFLNKNIRDFSDAKVQDNSNYFWKNETSSSLIKSEQTNHICKDGTKIPVEVNITSGFLNGQKVILAMAHDMTATMKHIAELDKLRQKAEQASQAKSEFLSMMSHEFRTPLNSIIGYSELLINKFAKNTDDEKEHKWSEQIKQSGQDLLSIIDKVLDLISIDKEFETDTPQKSDLISQIDTSIVTYEKMADKNNIKIENNIQLKAPAYINASDKSLHMITDNLLSNAIKFNQPHGVVYIDLIEHSLATYELTIRDTGIGIKHEDITDAFVPFNRLGQENGPVTGNGVGLTLVKKIVDNIGAEITLSLPEQGGVCVKIILPKA